VDRHFRRLLKLLEMKEKNHAFCFPPLKKAGTAFFDVPIGRNFGG